MANERVRANGEGTIYEEPLKRWASFVTFADGERREIRRDTAKQVSATIRELKSSSDVASSTRPKQVTRWVGLLFVGDRRVKRTGRTKSEVVARLNELRVHQESGRGPGDGNKTVGDVLNVWWERFENGKERVGSRASRDWRQLSPSARHRYRWARNLLTEEFESRRLRTLTRDDIEKGLAKIAADRDLAHDSVKRVRAVLVEALRFAQGERWIAVNEAERSRIGYIGRGDGEPTWLLPDEARRLDAACEDAWYGTMFRTMLATGVRPGEAAGPLESGVDLDAGRMHVRMGRSRDDRGVAVLSDHLKTEQSIRTIVLPARIVDVLRKQRRELAEARLRAGNWPGEPRFMFPDESGRIASDSEVAHQFKSLCAAAGLEAKTPMALRHTCIRTLKDAGVAYSEIARQMGHKDTRMVERVYGRDRSDVPVGTAGAAVMDRLFTASASA